MTIDYRIPVLVVDDSQAMTDSGNLLAFIGFSNIHYARSGDVALAMMKKRRFGLIVSEWMMEPMSGFAFLIAARSDARNADVPIIMTTTDARTDRPAGDVSATAFITKPFTARALKARIEMVLTQGR